MKKTALMLVMFFVLVSPARAHLVKHYSKGMSETMRVHRHKLNLAHVTYVCENGSGRPKREHCRAERWLKRVLAPPFSTTWWGIVAPYNSKLEQMAICESGSNPPNWYINTGNGFYGGLQFDEGTWHSVGGSGYAHQHSSLEQKYRAVLLIRQRGYAPWPVCG